MTQPPGKTPRLTAAFAHFWQAPHRPLFLASFLCAFTTVAWWPLGVAFGLPAPGFEPVVLWHAHELIFGFAGAAVGGYLLTALPSWTGLPPIQGAPLKLLLGCWLLARLTSGLADHIPVALQLCLNLSYPLWLAAMLLYQTLSCGDYQKAGFGLAVLLLGGADALFMTAALSGQPEAALTILRTVVLGFALGMTIIGSRAIAAFTNNWLDRTNPRDPRINAPQLPRQIAQGALALALIAMLAGLRGVASVAMICAAIAMLWMMYGWRTIPALTNPLLAAQHLAFAWLPIGLASIGALWFAPQLYPMADAIHILTIGAMSGLIMAIAGRAACHHISGDMRASAGFVLGSLLVWAATWVRLAAPVFAQQNSSILLGAAGLWCLGWAVFIAGFRPALTGPVIRPVLSGKKHPPADPPHLLTEKSI
ncbi:NnrS family protein [Parasedimentitalea psychrophila]|uniref:NnrS family protein n=1 Tax=Parasedimentitalea psychrophila TaxID=2997337 RepID=A0A9Y2P1G0_9RHOB|nr:NnrS family protein [Parasedimentitalea psychrophila]WIY25561.1 NnrS family protein [Parasedimentitalea psychrophila]